MHRTAPRILAPLAAALIALAATSPASAQERLVLAEPGPLVDTRDTGAGLLLTAGVCLTLALPALGAVTSQVPAFDERMPEWAMATLGASAILGPFGVLALGTGLDYAAGGDGQAGLVAGSVANIVIGVLLGVLAVAIAPGIGAPWASAQEQARVSELLGVQAFAFGLSGSLALTGALALIPGPRS